MKKDPERDCRRYNVKARALEIFTALDLDKNGFVDEDEFIAGNCNIHLNFFSYLYYKDACLMRSLWTFLRTLMQTNCGENLVFKHYF